MKGLGQQGTTKQNTQHALSFGEHSWVTESCLLGLLFVYESLDHPPASASPEFPFQ